MRTRRVIAIMLVFLLAGGLAYRRLTKTPPAAAEGVTNGDATSFEQAAQPPGTPNPRQQLVGVWEDEFRGKRTMSLKDDGAGTMVVELKGLDALFASKLRFDMRWSVQDKVLTKTTIGGEPVDKVNLVLNMKGNTAVETILELTDNRLLLLDRDGKTTYDWKRVRAATNDVALPSVSPK
jgi:hypothetical protein